MCVGSCGGWGAGNGCPAALDPRSQTQAQPSPRGLASELPQALGLPPPWLPLSHSSHGAFLAPAKPLIHHPGVFPSASSAAPPPPTRDPSACDLVPGLVWP